MIDIGRLVITCMPGERSVSTVHHPYLVYHCFPTAEGEFRVVAYTAGRRGVVVRRVIGQEGSFLSVLDDHLELSWIHQENLRLL